MRSLLWFVGPQLSLCRLDWMLNENRLCVGISPLIHLHVIYSGFNLYLDI